MNSTEGIKEVLISDTDTPSIILENCLAIVKLNPSVEHKVKVVG